MRGKVKEFEIEKLFSALADRTRLRLLSLMADGEVCVCFFVEVLDESQPKISRHLAYLRNAGVVSARREGKWMHYSIVEPPDPYAKRIFNEVRAWLAEDADMKRDRERLEKVCCGVKVPFTLKYAPLPMGIVAQPQEVALQAESPVQDEVVQAVRKSNSLQDSNWLDYD
jgi:ArsR family transcriptional regulator, arsenate/arsenite/antimonite-responsive transcriptional repressor